MIFSIEFRFQRSRPSLGSEGITLFGPPHTHCGSGDAQLSRSLARGVVRHEPVVRTPMRAQTGLCQGTMGAIGHAYCTLPPGAGRGRQSGGDRWSTPLFSGRPALAPEDILTTGGAEPSARVDLDPVTDQDAANTCILFSHGGVSASGAPARLER
jgi:hypothetical protein